MRNYSLRAQLAPDIKAELDDLVDAYARAFPHSRASISEVIRFLVVNGGKLLDGTKRGCTTNDSSDPNLSQL